jgi:dinuclear metal center YbgI/SA1388 family protein
MASVAVDELVADLDELLRPGDFADYGPNGLQVPGAATADTVVTGVSASAELFERAREAGAGLVLVHHGIFWSGPPRPLDPAAKRRLKLLFDADLALAAYHLPLDAHPEVGNNALVARALGATGPAPFAEHRGRAIGVRAAFAGDGIEPGELVARVRAAVGGREPLAFLAGPERVRTVGIVTGGAPDHLEDAIALGLDAFLTGEPAERVMTRAQEAGVHFLAAGHYATETFGVRALGDRLAERFGVRHVFVDVPNPI